MVQCNASIVFIIVQHCLFKVHDIVNSRQKESARLTMGLNYWNFCAHSFLTYCLAQPSPSPILEEKVRRGKTKCLSETNWRTQTMSFSKVNNLHFLERHSFHHFLGSLGVILSSKTMIINEKMDCHKGRFSLKVFHFE